MTELALVVVILGLIGYIAYNDRLNREERKMFIRVIKAKNASELRDLEYVDTIKEEQRSEGISDLVPESEATDEEWAEAIRQEVDDASR